MLNNLPKVAVVYLSFHSEKYFPDVIEALKKLNYPKDKVEVVIVDNPHPVHGLSKTYVEAHILPISGTEIPHVTYLPQSENSGFGPGMNTGVKWAEEMGYDYVFFHNNDGSMAPDCLLKLVNAMEADPQIGLAQSLVVLDKERSLLNTSGNAFHYLGFGYCNDYRKPISELNVPMVYDIPYASGAALMVKTSLTRSLGAWDTDFWMYHEDLEWSLRLRTQKYRVVCVRNSVFYHQYEFSKSITKYYWMERNRFAVLLMFYKWPTILLILPIMLPLELGLWLFALKGGWFKERLKVVQYWIQPNNWQPWLKKRKNIQALRQIKDKDLLATATGSILFQENSLQNPLLTKVANPVMEFYFKLLKFIVRW